MAKKNPYLESMVMTASPQQLQLMLYDGAIKFIDQAIKAHGEQNWESLCENTGRARAIVGEFLSSLRPDQSPELCKKLAAIYMFLFRQLAEAGMKREVQPLKDCRRVLKIQREGWAELCQKLAKENGEKAQSESPAEAPDPNNKVSIAI